jgi:hypothetical protein
VLEEQFSSLINIVQNVAEDWSRSVESWIVVARSVAPSRDRDLIVVSCLVSRIKRVDQITKLLIDYASLYF